MGPGAGIVPDGKMLSGMFTTTKVSETHAWRRVPITGRHTRRPGGRHSREQEPLLRNVAARKVSVGSTDVVGRRFDRA
jgi:hypothetical protein